MKLILTIALFLGFCSGAYAEDANSGTASHKGIASFYHPKFEGRKTATGEVFTNDKFTAASNRLKLNTYVKVTNQSNGRVVYVKVNDRMSPGNKRILDLTEAAADQLGYRKAGLARVTMEVVPDSEGQNGILAQREALRSSRRGTL